MTTKSENRQQYRKIEGCIYTYVYGCKGCRYNQVPDLRDGGCMIAKGVVKDNEKTKK